MSEAYTLTDIAAILGMLTVSYLYIDLFLGDSP